jgi:hypothetical protein
MHCLLSLGFEYLLSKQMDITLFSDGSTVTRSSVMNVDSHYCLLSLNDSRNCQKHIEEYYINKTQ